MRLQKLASHLDNEELYILLMLFILLQDAPTIRMEDVLKFIYKMVLIKIQSLYCLENFDEARNLLSTFINEMTQFKNCMYHYLNIKWKVFPLLETRTMDTPSKSLFFMKKNADLNHDNIKNALEKKETKINVLKWIVINLKTKFHPAPAAKTDMPPPRGGMPLEKYVTSNIRVICQIIPGQFPPSNFY